MLRRVLVCDDQADVVEALRLLLKGAGYKVDTAYSPHELIGQLDPATVHDAIVMDMNYSRDTTSGDEGLELVAGVRARRPNLPIIVMTAWGSVDLAVEAMQRGASDFVQKPWDNAKLLKVVEKQIAKASAVSGAYSELEIARSVQQGLFPSAGGEIADHCTFEGLCIPAKEIGGDYYDFLRFPDGRLGLVVADVSGKGVPAALLMANLQALFRSQVTPDVRTILRNINGHFHKSTPPSHYATVFFAIYDSKTRQLTYANCGHPAAILMPGRRALDTTATVVGIIGDAFDVDVETIKLAPGDTLFVVTDGITEAGIDDGEEFGHRRVEALLDGLTRDSGTPLAEILATVARAAEAHARGDHSDDMTLIGLGICR